MTKRGLVDSEWDDYCENLKKQKENQQILTFLRGI